MLRCPAATNKVALKVVDSGRALVTGAHVEIVEGLRLRDPVAHFSEAPVLSPMG